MGRTCGEPDEIGLTAMGVKLNGAGGHLGPFLLLVLRDGEDGLDGQQGDDAERLLRALELGRRQDDL